MPPTTIYGQHLQRRNIADIQHTVCSQPHLSGTRLGRIVCESLGWRTPPCGRHRIQSAMRLLKALDRTVPQGPIEDRPASLEPHRLRLANGREEAGSFNEWIEHYHSFGCHPRYFPTDHDGCLLGRLLYDFAFRRQPVRNRWIGRQHQRHRKHLDRVVRQAHSPPLTLAPAVRTVTSDHN